MNGVGVSATSPRRATVPREDARSSAARDGEDVLGREPMGAHTRGGSVHPPASTGLGAGSEGDQHGWRRSTPPLARELGRYTVAGGLAALVDVGLLWGLTQGMGVYYLHAAAVAFGVGLLTSYLLSIGWVFHQRTWQNPWVEVGFFTLIGGLGLLWCGICMWFLTEYVHLHYLCAKLVSALGVFCWNFVAKKWVVFHR
jgi:putative flippase GtrA